MLPEARRAPPASPTLPAAGDGLKMLAAIPSALRQQLPFVDGVLLLLVACLFSLGMVMVTSASIDHSGFGNLWRYLFFMGITAMSGTIVLATPLGFWLRYGWLFLLAGFVLLVLVLVPGIGNEVNGSRRWIHLGPLNLQSSEVAKFCLVVYLAGYLVRREAEVRESLIGFIKPVGLLAIMVALLMLEPDLGSIVLLFGTGLVMLFLGGVNVFQFMVALLVGVSAGVAMLTVGFRMKRLHSFMDPWADQYGAGYQVVNSLIAFGRGQWVGLGLGNSVQKQSYLPEAHTDFLFAIIAEELGFVGAVSVVLLFALLVGRILWIGRRAELSGRRFGAYMTYGVAILIAAQVFIHVGVNTSLLPNKGLTLPFLSYGGSSLLVIGAFMGLVLRVECDNRSMQLPELQKRVVL